MNAEYVLGFDKLFAKPLSTGLHFIEEHHEEILKLIEIIESEGVRVRYVIELVKRKIFDGSSAIGINCVKFLTFVVCDLSEQFKNDILSESFCDFLKSIIVNSARRELLPEVIECVSTLLAIYRDVITAKDQEVWVVELETILNVNMEILLLTPKPRRRTVKLNQIPVPLLPVNVSRFRRSDTTDVPQPGFDNSLDSVLINPSVRGNRFLNRVALTQSNTHENTQRLSALPKWLVTNQRSSLFSFNNYRPVNETRLEPHFYPEARPRRCQTKQRTFALPKNWSVRPAEEEPKPAKNFCVICFIEEKKYACIPCGHKVLCKSCYSLKESKFTKCPVCRKPCDRILEIFD